jgi:peptidoglycan DL-endopeptidase LytF
MTINRKDTILIAVLMNIGLLTVLFITAMSFEEDTHQHPSSYKEQIALTEEVGSSLETLQLASTSEFPTDEVDRVLQDYEAKNIETPVVENIPEKKSGEDRKYVEITVKRGDSLDRIARANRTSIREIKNLNSLTTDRLRIGQILKIPLPESNEAALQTSETKSTPPGAVYYELKSGDNPWKVAKKFNVSYESIVELNDLTESKAKALKPGNKIRIK